MLSAQRKLYEKCGGNFDVVYGESMDNEFYTGKVIEPGHIYELGYHSCTCQKVLPGQIRNPEQCECSRQSILYILSQLEPNSSFELEILETILRGGEHCKFRITKNKN